MKTLVTLFVAVLLLGTLSAAAFAADSPVPADDTTAAAPASAEAPPKEAGFTTPRAIAIVGASIAAAMCVIGGGLAIAKIGAQCIEAIARQPEAAGTMFAPMIVSAAMVEGGMLFGIVVCLLGVLG